VVEIRRTKRNAEGPTVVWTLLESLSKKVRLLRPLDTPEMKTPENALSTKERAEEERRPSVFSQLDALGDGQYRNAVASGRT
jgi:hypothetical protein